jgi:DNA (cytosine-5)-methyltransferase 1
MPSQRIRPTSMQRSLFSVTPDQEIVELPRATAAANGYAMASLFSGIGGIDLGFERAGFEIKYQCETQPFCLSVLEQHWPSVPKGTDIREVSSAEIPTSDIWVAGFPCQDVSLARMGKRDGLRGRQSGLFFEFARLLGEARPRVFLLENVSGLLSSHKGRDFGIVLRTLAQLGYSLGWRVLNSKNFGVPQSRSRVYVVGCHRDRSGPAAILFESERSKGNPKTSKAHGPKSLSPFKRILKHPGKKGPVTKEIAYCLYAESARHTGTDWSRNYVAYPDTGDVRRLTPAECEGVMTFPTDWTVLRGMVSSDETDSARYHALGNAVTPPVAEWIASRIHNYLVSVEYLDEDFSDAAAAAA